MKEEVETQRSKREVGESKESMCAQYVGHVTKVTARCRSGRGMWVKSREGGWGREGRWVRSEEGGCGRRGGVCSRRGR